jgi:uncharacterized protein
MTSNPGRRMLTLDLLPETFAICRFPADAPVPAWAATSPFLAVVRTKRELSVTCAEELLPATLDASRDWRGLELRGPLDHGLVGILVDVAAPLARARVPIMPIATYDTDYILVRAPQLALAVATLRAAGHTVVDVDAHARGAG